MNKLTEEQIDRVKCLFKLMEYDYLTEDQLYLVESFESQFNRFGSLSERQIEVLESINQQANLRDKPFRRGD